MEDLRQCWVDIECADDKTEAIAQMGAIAESIRTHASPVDLPIEQMKVVVHVMKDLVHFLQPSPLAQLESLVNSRMIELIRCSNGADIVEGFYAAEMTRRGDFDLTVEVCSLKKSIQTLRGAGQACRPSLLAVLEAEYEEKNG